MTQSWIEKLLELKQSGRRIRITADNDSMRADDDLAHLGFVVEGA